jgi:hypothetical protein
MHPNPTRDANWDRKVSSVVVVAGTNSSTNGCAILGVLESPSTLWIGITT